MSVCYFFGGDKGIRTPDLRIANATLYQLSHIPTSAFFAIFTCCVILAHRCVSYVLTMGICIGGVGSAGYRIYLNES